MSITEVSKKYHEKMFLGYVSPFLETDPEFIERFDNFAFDEVLNHDDLEDKTRFPVEVKETVYQAVAYLGIGRVLPFLKAVNEVFKEQGVELPLPGQATTTMENRLEAGEQAPVLIIGSGK